MARRKHCGIEAAGGSIGHAACDQEWGHDGVVHYSDGDGFYARGDDKEHYRRQRERRAAECMSKETKEKK